MRTLNVADTSEVAQARRHAAAEAERLGFDDVQAGRVALLATELATNLLKHGGGGELLVAPADDHIDLLALDSGRGMADVSACLADGFSTAGTPGNGLGAVRRAAAQMGVVSWPQLGTSVFARVCRLAETERCGDDELGAVVLPMRGEEACGDAWAEHRDANGHTVFVVDGLGHGAEAARAAHEAVRQFHKSRGAAPDQIVQAVHHALRPTRGGAVAAARIDWASGSVHFAGLGNIAAVAVGHDGTVRRMVSHNGTAGHNARRIQAFEYPVGPGWLVMHSDGLSSQWTLDRYAGLARAHPMLVAGTLYRHHARGRDDTTVVVCSTTRPQ